MSKLIALRSGYEDGMLNAWQGGISSHLKQQALLFDQIGIFDLDGIVDHAIFRVVEGLKKEQESLKLEFEWLRETGIIFEPSMHDIKAEFLITVIGETLFSDLTKNMEEYKKLAEKPNKIPLKVLEGMISKGFEGVDVDDFYDDAKHAFRLFLSHIEIHSIILRLISLSMEGTEKATAVTNLSIGFYAHQIPNSKKSDVAQIIINKLPLPSNTNSWEQIIDYRNDSKNQKNLLNLRRWIRKISTENLSSAELEEEIEWLMNEFQTTMNLHKLKANTEALEVMVKAPLEIIENLIKLKFSKIPEPLFALKKRQINLMEAELNAPGREMSYIIKTRDAFQSQE